jgi:hypothetical protein
MSRFPFGDTTASVLGAYVFLSTHQLSKPHRDRFAISYAVCFTPSSWTRSVGCSSTGSLPHCIGSPVPDSHRAIGCRPVYRDRSEACTLSERLPERGSFHIDDRVLHSLILHGRWLPSLYPPGERRRYLVLSESEKPVH